MKTPLILAGFVGVAMVLATVDAQSARPRSSGSADPDDLTEHIAQLESRVARLEARVGRQDASSLRAPGADDDAHDGAELTGRILQLDGIDTVEPDGTEDSDEIKRLQRDVDSLENNVQRQTERLKSMAGQGRRGGSYRSGRGGYKSAGTYDKRSAQADLTASYRKRLGEKKRELNRLEKELTETKQIIHGHRGNTIITLHTSRDLSGALGRVDIGGYLKWNGRRSSATAGSEEWAVSSVTAADAP